MTTPNQREHILQKAYEIWKSEGCPTGRDMEHWLLAERELVKTTAKPKAKAKPAAKAKAKPVSKAKPKPAAKAKAKPAAKAKPKPAAKAKAPAKSKR